MIFTITSTNPDLSYVLSKNPATITNSMKPFSKKLRKGMVYGWYTNSYNNQFRLMFKDHPSENSYRFGESADFEYLDVTRYSSPMLYLDIISQTLASASKNPDAKDSEEYESSCEFICKVKPSKISLFQSLPDYSADIEVIKPSFQVDLLELVKGFYRVRITSNSVFNLLSATQYFCILARMFDSNSPISGPLSEIERFLKVLNNCKAGIFPRYLLSSRLLKDQISFEKMKPLLDWKDGSFNYDLKFGDTRYQRYWEIWQELSNNDSIKGTTRYELDRHLLDVGCGEGFYAVRLAPKYDSYLGIDKDEELVASVNRILDRKNLDFASAISEEINEFTDESIYNLRQDGCNDVLLTEVLEHMPKQQAESLLKSFLNNPKVQRIVVTVPNRDFNKYYLIKEGDMRHNDHFYEPTFQEWRNFCIALANSTNRQVVIKGIGDCADSISTSIMAVFTFKSMQGE